MAAADSRQTDERKRRKFVQLVAAAIVTFSGCWGTPHLQRDEEPFDDFVIKVNVEAALDAERRIRATFIEVEASQGIVRLSGFADSRLEAEQAIAAARRVAGVKRVKDDIVVRRGAIRRRVVDSRFK